MPPAFPVNSRPAPDRPRAPRWTILAIAGVLLVAAWYFRESVTRSLSERVTLANDAPVPDHLAETILQAADPESALLKAWNTGRIIHRQVAIRILDQVAPVDTALSPALDLALLAAAVDADLSVRELSLNHLQLRRHPQYFALAAHQLRDPDPQVRLLGLQHLKSAAPGLAVPLAVSLLNDPDPLVLTMALKRIESWTGQSFGVRLADTVSQAEAHPDRARELALAGADRARTWWSEHQNEFAEAPPSVPDEVLNALQRYPAGDFELADLSGKKVRLSDFRGRPVLLNFWTTWCTACLKEIPALVALHQRYGDQLAVLGVSLDFTPDSHGHLGGHAAVEDQSSSGASAHHHESSRAALKKVHDQIARTAQRRGMTYPVLLDVRNSVGARFNGGELPTTVLIDPAGNVSRRFVGARSLATLEALVADTLLNTTKPPLPRASLPSAAR